MPKDIHSNAADVAALLDRAASSYVQWMKKLSDIQDIRRKMRQYVDEARNCVQAAVQSNVTKQDCNNARKDFNNMSYFGSDVKKLLDMMLDVILPESKLKQFPWKDDVDVVFSGSDDVFDCNMGTIHFDIVSKKLKRAVIVYVPVKDAIEVDFLGHNLQTGKYVVKALTPEFSEQQANGQDRRKWYSIASYTFPSSIIEAMDAYFSGKLDSELKVQSTPRIEETTYHFNDYDMYMRNTEPYASETSVSYIDRELFDSLDTVKLRRCNRPNKYEPSIDHMLNDDYLLELFRKSI